MFQIMIVLLIIIYHTIQIESAANSKYEVILENATVCHRPQPPYPNKPSFLTTFEIRKTKDTIYLSGQHRVLVEVPFLNLTLTSYKSLTSGVQEKLASVENLNCRSWLGKMFLTIGQFQYSRQSCLLHKGTFGYTDLDINKVFHRIPNWHSTGRIMHRTSLFYNGSTIFCNEISVVIKALE